MNNHNYGVDYMEDYISNSALYFIDRSVYLLSAYIGAAILFLAFQSIRINKNSLIYVLFTSLTIPVVCLMLGGINDNIIVKLIYIISMCIFLMLLNYKKIYSSVAIAIVSVAITLCLQYFGIFISSLILFSLNHTNNKLLATLIACVIQFIICIVLTRIRWIRKCFSYLENENHVGLGLLLTSYIFAFSLLITQLYTFDTFVTIILVAVCPLAFTGLILWIRNLVQRYYKKKISDRADAYTQQEIANKDEYIQKLEVEVATLSKQLHRDNHLLSSLDHSVQVLGDSDSAEQKERIIDEIHTLYRERNELITKEQQENKILPSTGIAVIDSALSELYIKATAHGISFDLMVGEELHYLVNNIISQTDLQTLLCDHIKDAIIAVESSGNDSGKILVSIDKNDGIFEISIRDNGVDFDPETLAKLGLERVTTHAESGGSGIGFVTTFETLKKTKGSLIITEYENKTLFSKSVAFIFDGLNQFIINSYRKEDLKNRVNRDDIAFI